MYDVRISPYYNQVLKTILILLLEISIFCPVDYIYFLMLLAENVLCELSAFICFKCINEFQTECYFVFGCFDYTLTFVYDIKFAYDSHVLSIPTIMCFKVNIYLLVIYFFVPSDFKNG